MKLFARMSVRAAVAASIVTTTIAQAVVINEIMFHPLQPVVGPEPTQWEFVELYNPALTNVNLSGWYFSKGVTFTFPPGASIPARGYVVVGASVIQLEERYPSLGIAYGGWTGKLANSGETIELKNAQGVTIDEVSYADDGDWAVRQRSPVLSNQRGWIWTSLADGGGRSLERRNPALPGSFGQNWTVSAALDGTPSADNSARSANVAPLVTETKHLPIIPKSTDRVTVTARVLDESAVGVTVTLFFRTNLTATPTAFVSVPMLDNGTSGDGVSGDKLFGVVLPEMPNNTLIEFYVQASDAQSNVRTWPAPAFDAADLGGASLGQAANAMFQVDDAVYPLVEPLYKLVMTPAEVSHLQTIFGSPQSDAQVNVTFLSVDGTGVECRYLCGVRNRGNGSRNGTPHNHRINFRSDEPWRGVEALNVNARVVPAQVAGSMMALKAGAAGANVHFARLLVNNGDSPGVAPANGLYAANEAKDADWSDRIFPDDGGGNVYLVQRNDPPPNFDYRGTNPAPYKHTYFKQSNVAADDWTDLIAMLEVMGENQTASFTMARARAVINLEQWLVHLAVMNLFGNNESGVNTGNNDDYYFYSGADGRFSMIYHDLDTVLGQGGSLGASDGDIFRATCCPISGDSEGIWRAMNFFMHHPEVEPLYYRTLQDLLDGPFSAEQFNPAIDTLFASYPQLANAANTIKNYMATKRTTVLSVIADLVPTPTRSSMATIVGAPRVVTPVNAATITVGGDGVTHYRYKLNNGAYTSETPVATPINLTGLAQGSNVVFVIGRNIYGVWQSSTAPTIASWFVNASWPGVRLNEVLARNNSAAPHEGTFPDVIELFNEGATTIDLAGMRLTDDLTDSNKFVFPAGITLAPGGYLVLYANDPDGTSGLHVGFGLGQNGDSLYLLQAAGAGGVMLDAMSFGPQVANRSIGRFGNGGDWRLALPTLGATNTVQAVGSPASLKINEWLAASEPPLSEDFVELYNPLALPVPLGGLYLSDQPLGRPAQHRIAVNSFVGAGDFVNFVADGDAAAGAEHLNFRLSAALGSVALFDVGLRQIDYVIYTPQTLGISMGRCPDGGVTNFALTLRTPGAPNYCPVPPPPPPPPVVVNLVSLTNDWRYFTNGVQPAPNWTSVAYDDSGWHGSGPGLLGRIRTTANATLPELVRTPIGIATVDPGKLVYHFRTKFNLPSVPNFTSLQISNVVDDGAVFYLNGIEVGRFNMPPGPVTTNTPSASGVSDAVWATPSPSTINLANLRSGDNVIAVQVHATVPTSVDMIFGLRMDGIIVTNVVSVGGLVINEVLTDNRGGTRVDGRTPDWIEIYNPTANSADLGGMSLNDQENNSVPRWFFPAGSIVPAHGFLVVYADADVPASSTNTGFGFKAKGGAVYLFNRAPNTNQIVDFVQYGLQTADLSISRIPAGSANWVLSLPTPGLANVVAALGNPSLLRINEWMADPASGDDWFEIYNGDTRPVSLTGLRLSDTFGAINAYRIPALSYIGVGSNAFVRFEADEPLTPSGPEHVNFKLSKGGDSIFLQAANNGPQIDAVVFGPQQLGVSEGRLPDGAGSIAPFPQSPTPEDSNYRPLASLAINEVLAHTDLPLEDAVEVRNLTGQSINISGWWLSDAKDVLRKYPIPAGTTVPAFGFKVFYEFEFNDDAYGAPFSLSSAEGDQVYLSEGNVGGYLSGQRVTARFGPSANAVSFGRYVNSIGSEDYVALSALTFGTTVTAQDPPDDIDVFRTGSGAANAYPKVGPIVVSEIMYHPSDVGTNDNVVEEFIELRNTGAEVVPLFDPAFPTNGWRLRDAVSFTFNSSHSIPPDGHLLVVSFDPETNAPALASFRAKYGTTAPLVGPYSGKLDNSSESVELVRPDAPQIPPSPDAGMVPYILVEKIVYADRGAWSTNADGWGMSLQRVSASGYANEPTNWVALAPTPGPTGDPDTDSDGMPDAWEEANGLDKSSAADALLDHDGDGLKNRDEYLAGTDPQNGGSSLRLSVVRNGTHFDLTFQAVAGRSYRVLYSDSLLGGWQRLTDVPAAGSNLPVTVSDEPVAPRTQRFYRLITPSGQ